MSAIARPSTLSISDRGWSLLYKIKGQFERGLLTRSDAEQSVFEVLLGEGIAYEDADFEAAVLADMLTCLCC